MNSIKAAFYDNPKTYDEFHPLLYSLKDVEWSIFCSLTWNAASRRKPTFDAELLRRIDFKQLINRTCAVLKTRPKHFCIYHCMEWGLAGECHFHSLILNRRPNIVPDAIFADTMQYQWTDEFQRYGSSRRGAGTAKVVPYDMAKQWPAVNYCLKREFDGHGQHRERFDDISQNLRNYLLRIRQSSSTDGDTL